MAITRALRARVVRDYLTRSRAASTTALFSLDLILTSRRNLAIIRPHLTLVWLLFGARALSYALPDIIDAYDRLTSRSPLLNWAGSVAIRVGVLLV